MQDSPALRPAPASPAVVAAWCLYDFANSTYSAVIAATVFSVYYTSRVVGNADGRGDFWWGAVVIPVSAIAVALSSPIMGAIADMAGARKVLLATYTGVAIAAVAAFTTVGPGDVVWGAVLAIIANFAMEGGVVFYNAYLPDLVPRDRIGRVSGYGFAVGYVGSVAALLLALPLAAKERFDAIWLMVAVLFALFSLPALIALPKGGPARMSLPNAAAHGIRGVRGILRDLLGLKDLRRFLLAYFLYMNGVEAAIFFSGPYAERTMGMEPSAIIVLFLIVQVSALVGALAMARPTDVLGPKWVVRASLITWIVTIGVLVATPNATVFRIGAALAGLGLGSVQAASRAFMSTLVPAGREDEFFGFYALCGKSSAPLGCLVFAGVSLATGSQRAAVLALLLFFVAGLLLLARVRAGGPTRAPSSLPGHPRAVAVEVGDDLG